MSQVAGSTFFGHYVCYVRDSNGEWWSLDDERVTPADWAEVSAVNPFQLFYTREQPHLRYRALPAKKDKEAKSADDGAVVD